jgi:hypothetical protein
VTLLHVTSILSVIQHSTKRATIWAVMTATHRERGTAANDDDVDDDVAAFNDVLRHVVIELMAVDLYTDTKHV